jgi:TP901 family phage tail tape measure protein
MATHTSTLIATLVDRITGPARAAAGSLRGITAAAQQASAANARSLGAMRGSLVDATAAGFVLVRGLTAPLKAAMAFEEKMADVRKVVDFPTPQAFQDLQKSVLEMSTRIPVAASGLADIVAAAGQAGIAGADLLPFAENAAKIGVAFDISAGTAGEAMAKLRTALGLTNPQVFSLADAMNELSNAQASSAADILDVVRRVGAEGTMFGFTGEQTAAFASAMLAAGAESEVAATSFRNMGLALTKGASATKGQKGAFKRLGLDAKKTARDMQKDAVGTTLKVIEAIGKLPEAERAAVSNALFGSEARALGPLLTNLDALKEALGIIGDESKYAGSAQREFEVRAATSANAVRIFGNRLNVLSIAIGAALLPALNDAMLALQPLVHGMSDFAREHPAVTAGIVKTAAALVGFRIAATAARFGALYMAGGVISTVSAVSGLGVAAAGAAAKVGRGFVALGTHVAGVTQTAAMRFGMMRAEIASGAIGMAGIMRGTFATMARSIGALLFPVAAVTAGLKAMKWALIGTGVGAVLVGIGTAGKFIYDNWNGIKAMFQGIGEGIRSALGPQAAAGFDQIIAAGQRVVSFFSNMTLGASLEQWRSFGASIGSAIAPGIASAIALGQGLLDFFLAIPGKIAAAFSAVKGWAASMSSGINATEGGTSPAAGPAAAPSNPSSPALKRATGGPVQAGKRYLIGEKGRPEVFVPGVSGRVIADAPAPSRGPERKLRRSLPAPMHFTLGGITNHITGVSDPRAAAEMAADMSARKVASAMRGVYADIGRETI